MTCQDFLSSHSDYMDGRLDADADARCSEHVDACPECARHHRIITRSLRLLGDVPTVEPSSDFHDRLQHRILHLQDEMARHDRFSGSGTMASLAVAAVIALVAWAPLMLPDAMGGDKRIADARSLTTRAARTASRDMAPVEWYGSAPGTPVQDGPLSMSAAFPGPYSPLIVEAPVTRASGRAARAVFAAYYPGVE